MTTMNTVLIDLPNVYTILFGTIKLAVDLEILISSFTDSFFGVVQVKKVKKKRKSNKSKKPRFYSEKSGLFFRWLNEQQKAESYKKLQKAKKSWKKCGPVWANVASFQTFQLLTCREILKKLKSVKK
jgi:hypothetical protein